MIILKIRGLSHDFFCLSTTLCKYADPFEDEIIGIDPGDARAVCWENPELIYLLDDPMEVTQ